MSPLLGDAGVVSFASVVEVGSFVMRPYQGTGHAMINIW